MVEADRNCLNNLAVQFAKEMIPPADADGLVAFGLFSWVSLTLSVIAIFPWQTTRL